MKVLIMFSGGIDSAYLVERAIHAGHEVVIHHVSLRNKFNRWQLELEAVNNLLHLWRDRGYKFKYSTSIIDNTELPMTQDAYYTSSLASVICSKDLTIDDAWLGFLVHEDYNIEYYERVFNAGISKMPSHSYQGTSKARLAYPLITFSKLDVVNSISGTALALTWSCRTPDSGEPCGNCSTCNALKKLK